MRERVAAVAFVACLLPLIAASGFLATRGALDVRAPATAAALGLGAGAWLAALLLARRVRDSLPVLVALATGALALRLVFLAGDPGLSDDLERYVFEGARVAEGGDPYAHAPNAPELAEFRTRWRAVHARVNHPDVPAVYPPLAQALHAAVVTLAGGAAGGDRGDGPERARRALRALYAACDLAVLVPLALLLVRRRRPLAWLAAWAWCPWMALEFAGSGHLDALAILATLTALACLPPRGLAAPGRAAGALAAVAVGAATKLLPLAFAPFVLARVRRPWLGALVLALLLALACLPFVLLTGALPRPGGLGEYAFRWESASLSYRWIEPVFARRHVYDESWTDPRRLARALVLAAWLALALGLWWRRAAPVRATALLVGAFLALTPTLHPWYVAWCVPFLALFPSLAFAALAAAAPLLYWPLGDWRAAGV
jgi:hypothetical protein